ncbi:hypothetical protein [Azospirillum endophyticum]
MIYTIRYHKGVHHDGAGGVAAAIHTLNTEVAGLVGRMHAG